MLGNPQVTTIKTVKQMDELVDMGGEATAWHQRWRFKLSNLFHQVEYNKHCKNYQFIFKWFTEDIFYTFAHFIISVKVSCTKKSSFHCTLLFKSLGSVSFFFIQQACIKLIKSDRKDIYNVTEDLYLNTVLLKILFTKESWKKVSCFPQKY